MRIALIIVCQYFKLKIKVNFFKISTPPIFLQRIHSVKYLTQCSQIFFICSVMDKNPQGFINCLIMMLNKNTMKILYFLAYFVYLNGLHIRKSIIQEQLMIIAIIGTNDFHGRAFPDEFIREDTGQKYSKGGLVYLGRLIEIIKKQFTHRVLYFDSGDEFQGTLQSQKMSKGEIMTDFFNIIGLDLSVLGNHEFDQGYHYLNNFLQKKQAPTICANLESEKGEKDFLYNQRSTKTFQIQGIKLGVIGMTTYDTKAGNAFIQHLFPNYKILSYAGTIQSEAKKLKKKGVNSIILLCHEGNTVPQNQTYDLRTNRTKQEGLTQSIMTQLIKKVPEGTIDAIVQGHVHQWVHHWYQNIPIMGSIMGGFFFNVMYLTYDMKTKKLVNSSIQGPIPVCEKIFENKFTCSYQNEEQLLEAGQLVPWKFHGEPVYPHSQIKQLFTKKWEPKMKDLRETVFKTEIVLEKILTDESPLGNLVSFIFHKAVPHAEFTLIDVTAFRTVWYPGIVEYRKFYQMFPFKGRLNSFTITGQELKNSLSLLQQKDNLYFGWNLNQVIEVSEVKKIDGTTSVKKRLTHITLDGQEIQDNKMFRGATLSHFLDGGSDFIDIIGKTMSPKDIVDEGEEIQLLEKQFRKLGVVRKGEWIDRQNPQILFIKK